MVRSCVDEQQTAASLRTILEAEFKPYMVLTSGYSHVLAEEGRHGFELPHKP